MSIFTPKWKNKDEGIRMSAINEIHDENLLFEIATTDISDDVRSAAVSRITSEDKLIELVKMPMKGTTRIIAVNKIQNEIRLKSIYKEIDLLSVKKAILGKITDKEFLLQIAENGPENGAAAECFLKLLGEDIVQSELLPVIESKSQLLREKILDRISDQSLLYEVYINPKYLVPSEKVLRKINDPAILARIINAVDKSKINDVLKDHEQTVISELLLFITTIEIIPEVLNFIYREDLLLSICNRIANVAISAKIKDRIEDIVFLKQMLNNYSLAFPSKYPLDQVNQILSGAVDVRIVKFLDAEKIYHILSLTLNSEGKQVTHRLCTILRNLGVNFNETTSYYYVLTHAVCENNVDLVKLLLEEGASPLVFASNYISPLFEAISDSRKEILDLFLAWGVDIDLELPRIIFSDMRTYRDFAKSRGISFN